MGKQKNMDRLERAMQDESFWVGLADASFGKVVLHGKNTDGIGNGNAYYEISREVNADGDFCITYFQTYERLKDWLHEWQGDGFYDFLLELYEKEYLVKALEEYGVIVCQPEEKSIAELCAVLSVFQIQESGDN